MTTYEQNAKTLEDANEFLERLGIKSSVETIMKRTDIVAAIEKEFEKTKNMLIVYVDTVTDDVKPRVEEFIETVCGEGKKEAFTRCIEGNVKLYFTSNLKPLYFVFENPEIPEAIHNLRKAFESEKCFEATGKLMNTIFAHFEAEVFSDCVEIIVSRKDVSLAERGSNLFSLFKIVSSEEKKED